MSAAAMTDLSRCSIHTFTNKPWTLAQCISAYSKAGLGGITVWRNVIGRQNPAEVAKMLRDSGLKVPALARGGFFTATTDFSRQHSVDENRAIIDTARQVGAESLILVVGATPQVPLDEARKQVADCIAKILPQAESAGVKLAIEPLHPMYAADRSCINRMAEARKICEQFKSPFLGIAVDVYHTWWDPDLEAEIALAGQQKTLFGFHVCDWRKETRNLLTDRGLMGDGCIELRRIRGWVEAAGFNGFVEVEVFSDHYWSMDQAHYLELIKRAYLQNT
jgi:sugar phosphate isomerase/epimerase